MVIFRNDSRQHGIKSDFELFDWLSGSTSPPLCWLLLSRPFLAQDEFTILKGSLYLRVERLLRHQHVA